MRVVVGLERCLIVSLSVRTSCFIPNEHRYVRFLVHRTLYERSMSKGRMACEGRSLTHTYLTFAKKQPLPMTI